MRKKTGESGFVIDDNLAIKAISFSTFVCLAIFAVAIPLPRIDGLLVGADGVRYYSIALSIFFDFDLSFANQYELLGAASGPLTVTGLQPCNFAVGTPLLWLPFLAAAHLAAIVCDWAGMSIPLDGTSYLHQAFVCGGSIIYAGVGFALAFKVCRRLFSAQSALVGVMIVWWAGHAMYYSTAEPSMSHAPSVFAGALFLYFWFRPSLERQVGDWLKIGAAVGLAALIRWQEGVLIILPAAELIFRMFKKQISFKTALTSGLFLGVGVLVVFSPQFLMWKIVYGSFITIPQGPDYMLWLSPRPFLTLFSTRHGLISWHPVFLPALAGLINLWKRDRGLTLAVVFIFLAQLYINSSVYRWWAADAFGSRRFTALAPLMALPLAALWEDARTRLARRALTGLFAALIVWNGLSAVQYRFGFISKNGALSLREMTVERLLIPFKIMRSGTLFHSPPERR